eukprot:m.490294 g.490294  ORF g.490294 m.490294 type:complete len:85 (-) comp57249_c1_seq1:1695-1949(-)
MWGSEGEPNSSSNKQRARYSPALSHHQRQQLRHSSSSSSSAKEASSSSSSSSPSSSCVKDGPCPCAELAGAEPAPGAADALGVP